MQDSWHVLRGLRAKPPGKAARGQRAKLFRASLEQSEQLATAALDSGYAARPILLYYMVNQAARAIVAARGDTANASGHGLKARNLGATDLSGVAVAADGTGLVTELAAAIDNFGSDYAPIVGEVGAGELWAYLPRCGPWAAQAGLAQACALSIDWEECTAPDGDVNEIRVSGWPWPPAEIGPRTLKEVAVRVDGLVRSRYGVSAAWQIARTSPRAFFGDMPLITFDAKAGRFAVTFVRDPAAQSPGETIGEMIAWNSFGHRHRLRGVDWVLPNLIAEKRAHPLVAWYATLFLFSTLARYEPVAWRGHLDVDSSPYAVALQKSLDAAMEDVPALVQEALD